jgi:predicted nuclease of predicted toxin-antitoxin system
VKLVLDEMWSPAIAEQLRAQGHDVIAASASEHHERYGAISDILVFDRAQEDERAIVTDNIADLVPLAADLERRGIAHHGLILCSSRQFDRSQPAAVGQMVAALAALLSAQTAPGLFNRQHWLQRES